MHICIGRKPPHICSKEEEGTATHCLADATAVCVGVAIASDDAGVCAADTLFTSCTRITGVEAVEVVEAGVLVVVGAVVVGFAALDGAGCCCVGVADACAACAQIPGGG